MGYVTYETEGAVGILTIDRPKALNALNSEVLEDLNAALDQVDLDTIRCLILTGAGEKSFVAGAGIATAMANVISTVLMLYLYFSKRTTVPMSFKGYRFDPGCVKDIMHIGAPKLV